MERARILIVEDERLVAADLEHCLTQLGHEVVGCAATGQEAIEMASRTRPDLVLMDIMIDGLPDGIATAVRLRSELHISVIYLTANTDEAVIQKAKLTEPLGYIHKPFEESSLGVDIELALHRLKLEGEREQFRIKLSTVTNELRQVIAELEVSAIMDPLTEVYNRRGLQHILAREIQLAKRGGLTLTAAVLDIDDFKTINDTFGHPTGDIVLRETARRIRDSLRISDYVGRIGGDEFLLFLPGTSLQEGGRFAERLRLSLADMNLQISGTAKIRITVSIGLALVSTQTVSVDDVISLTDPLLRESKKEGKNQVHFEGAEYAPTPVVHKSGRHPFYASELKHRESFFAVKQSIHDLNNESIAGFEYLTRMRHDSIGMPNDFFRAAIESNMVTLVDHHCFNVCVMASSRTPTGGVHHINLLPSTIMDTPVDWLVEKLASDQKHYCLEICEQQVLGNSNHFKDAISTLKESGIEIAIDDVGFGNTSLESLLSIEPNVIKIDKKCVMGISNHAAMQKTLRHILRIAEDLNARVIAEGIETGEDFSTLVSLGVKYGQGYYWSKPA